MAWRSSRRGPFSHRLLATMPSLLVGGGRMAGPALELLTCTSAGFRLQHPTSSKPHQTSNLSLFSTQYTSASDCSALRERPSVSPLNNCRAQGIPSPPLQSCMSLFHNPKPLTTPTAVGPASSCYSSPHEALVFASSTRLLSTLPTRRSSLSSVQDSAIHALVDSRALLGLPLSTCGGRGLKAHGGGSRGSALGSRNLQDMGRGLSLQGTRIGASRAEHGVPPFVEDLDNDAAAILISSGGALDLSSPGSIHLIVGPMFAGKTTALLKRMRIEAEAGRRVLLVKSSKDDRYSVNAVVSHDGLRMPCIAVPTLSMLRTALEAQYMETDVIGIDEAQFFDDLEDFCLSAADEDRKTIVAAGLDGDFQRQRFGTLVNLVPMADTVTKLRSRCKVCGRSAPFTLRKTADTKTEVIGGSDVYMPVCRQHYIDGHYALRAAHTLLGEVKRTVAEIDPGTKAAAGRPLDD